ncbi:hypothetical protein LUZ60_014755 [Juncus effusus]|nr:hypothetical protein LUZ60_014755 [Juncus effusus]
MRSIFQLNRRTISFIVNYRFAVPSYSLRRFSDTGQGKDDENCADNTEKLDPFQQNKAETSEKAEGIDDNDEKSDSWQIPVESILGFPPEAEKSNDYEEPNYRHSSRAEMMLEAQKIFEILQQDGPGFNARLVLDEMQPQISNSLVREVLFRILTSINCANKSRCAKMAYKFFSWSSQQNNYSHNSSIYNLTMKIFAESEELKAMWRLLEEMLKNGLPVTACKGDKPLAALNLLNYMSDVGFEPSVLHFTNLIDGLSRAGNLDACKYFFDEMIKKGMEPDIVCYTVMITSYSLAGQFEDAHKLFDEMIEKGNLPNVYTYNTMIKGFCNMGRFKEAWSLLREMDLRGCVPNFRVYSNLVRRLRNAGKVGEANDVVNYMVQRGHYLHLASRFKGYRRK